MTINDDDDDDDDSGGDGGDVGQRLWSHDRLALYKTNSIIHIKNTTNYSYIVDVSVSITERNVNSVRIIGWVGWIFNMKRLPSKWICLLKFDYYNY